MASQRLSIDDAREPFDVDMAARIRLVEEAGRAMIVSRSLPPCGAAEPSCGVAALEALSHACHAIGSASRLVGARSLVATARLLAGLATAETPALGEACVEGAEAMRRMLALELRNREAEAWRLALELRERAERWHDAGAKTGKDTPKPPSVDQFSYDDEPRIAADAGPGRRVVLFPRRPEGA